RMVEAEPAGWEPRSVEGRTGPGRGGARGVHAGVGPHRRLPGRRSTIPDLVGCLLLKLFAAQAPSRTSVIFSASVHRSVDPKAGLQKILRRRFPGGGSRSPRETGAALAGM